MALTDPQLSSQAEGADPTPVTVEVAGHRWTIYEESGPLIAAMVDDIKSAKTRVWMETYIFADDAAGRSVAAALADRAAAGLDVRLMIDAWGSFSTPRSVFAKLEAAGVQVHRFHAFGEAFFRSRFFEILNQRNHRKLLVVDDRVAYFGGMNVVDASGIHSTAEAKSRHLPASAGWRDVHARIEGPRQAEIAAACDRLWRRVRHERGGKEPRWPVEQLLRSKPDAFFFFPSRPTFKYRRPYRVLAPLLRKAQTEITVSVAYFLPLGRVLRELVKARRRGVRVRVIVPGQSDVKLVQWATRHFYEYLLKRGIRVYERSDRMLHSKAIVIDHRWSVIGSCNLDARSLRLNLEFFAVANAPHLASAIERICEEEIRHSVRVTAAYCRSRSVWQRLRDRAAWAVRRWL
jgi:cardiolipin synthase A/B